MRLVEIQKGRGSRNDPKEKKKKNEGGRDATHWSTSSAQQQSWQRSKPPGQLGS